MSYFNMDYEQITRADTSALIRKYGLHCCVIGITVAVARIPWFV